MYNVFYRHNVIYGVRFRVIGGLRHRIADHQIQKDHVLSWKLGLYRGLSGSCNVGAYMSYCLKSLKGS